MKPINTSRNIMQKKMVIHWIQVDSLHKFNCIPAFILPQSGNISVTNGCFVATFCMSVWLRQNVFRYLFGFKKHLSCSATLPETSLRNVTWGCSYFQNWNKKCFLATEYFHFLKLFYWPHDFVWFPLLHNYDVFSN